MMRKTIILILATLIAASGSEALAQTGNAVSSSSENKREIRLTPCNKDKGRSIMIFEKSSGVHAALPDFYASF